MTASKQPLKDPCYTECDDCQRHECNVACECLASDPKIVEMKKNYNASHSSQPVPEPEIQDWRGLFVSDLIALITWDAKHGNPSLMDAVRVIEKHYAKPFSRQIIEHDAAIRKAERERVVNREITALSNQIGALQSLEPEFGSENEVEIRVLSRWRMRLQESLRGGEQR